MSAWSDNVPALLLAEARLMGDISTEDFKAVAVSVAGRQSALPGQLALLGAPARTGNKPPRAHLWRDGEYFASSSRSLKEEMPLMRRAMPIAGCRYEEDAGHTVFELAADPADPFGMELLTAPPGSPLSWLGPIGRPFRVESRTSAVLVAEGIGIGPMMFLAQWLSDIGRREPALFCGRGTALVDRLERHFRDNDCDPEESALYVAGADDVVREACAAADRMGVSCQVLCDVPIPCGMGICEGCLVPTDNGWRPACLDGPVFPAARLRWGLDASDTTTEPAPQTVPIAAKVIPPAAMLPPEVELDAPSGVILPDVADTPLRLTQSALLGGRHTPTIGAGLRTGAGDDASTPIPSHPHPRPAADKPGKSGKPVPPSKPTVPGKPPTGAKAPVAPPSGAPGAGASSGSPGTRSKSAVPAAARPASPPAPAKPPAGGKPSSPATNHPAGASPFAPEPDPVLMGLGIADGPLRGDGPVIDDSSEGPVPVPSATPPSPAQPQGSQPGKGQGRKFLAAAPPTGSPLDEELARLIGPVLDDSGEGEVPEFERAGP